MGLKNKFSQVRAFFRRHLYLEFLFEAVCMTMLIELISRKSLSGLLYFIGHSPLTFFVNVFIIFLTLSVTVLIPGRWRFAEETVLIVWGIMGVVNGVVLRYRMTPFSAEDLNMIPSLMRIMKNYLTTGTLVLLAAAIVGLCIAMVVLWKRSSGERIRVKWFNLAGRTALIAVSCFVFLNMSMQAEAISTDFVNLADAYEEYGFAYCFSTSLVDVGIDKPADYSEELMAGIVQGIGQQEKSGSTESILAVSQSAETDSEQSSGAATLEVISEIKTTASRQEDASEETENIIDTADADVQSASAYFDSATEESPNIIMIQLESFFDPAYLLHFTCSEDPIPNFHHIKETCASGFLTVPVVGAGTANTEFEILTGMSTDYFGAGEYPYNTVLKSTVTEAIPQILRQYGYTSTAVHNNTGTFYNRHIVFSHMGFDRFVPMEYMYDLEETPNNWVKDDILTDVMMDTLALSDGPDFIYTITVQSHGRYPSETVLEDPQITVTCDDETVNTNPYEYYVNMISEVDQMIGELTEALTKKGEPTVLIMFGDHLPALGFDAEDVDLDSLYLTEYVIWTNFEMAWEDRDIQAESLGTGILQSFGLDNGIIPQFHEAYDGTEMYNEYLEDIEYDMLYGDGYIYRSFAGMSDAPEDWTLYQASDMEMGCLPITLDYCSLEEDGLYVYGENFNTSSCIITDGKTRTTEYIDRQTLLLRDVPKTIETLAVGQFDEQLSQLGEATNVLTDVQTVLSVQQ